MAMIRSTRKELGGTLLASLISIAVITWLTAHVMFRITSRMQTAQRSAAWNEALTTAEAAVDMTVADITGLLPDVRIGQQSGITLGSSQLPTSLISSLGIGTTGPDLASGITLSFSPTPLTHGGEGAGKQEAKVFIDVLPLTELLNSNLLSVQSLGGLLSNPLDALNGSELKLIRLRAQGTVGIPGMRKADPDKLDSRLRRLTLVRDRLTGTMTTKPSVTRELRVVLRPVLPFENAVTSGGPVVVDSADSVFDSFNSLSPLASTLGRYDVTKRTQNGDVNAISGEVTLPAHVYGDVRTAGGNLTKTANITGNVDNDYSQPLPNIKTPTWSGNAGAPASVTGTTTLFGGLLGFPARYKFDSLTGTLRISAGLLNLNKEVEIWVRGPFTGTLILDNGVHAKVYVEGDVNLPSGHLQNNSQKASALEIYGLVNTNSTSLPTINIGLGNVAAAIYAPTHLVRLTGNGDFQGAITAGRFETVGAPRVHYDEGLALSVGPILRYAVASWMEQPL